MSSFDPRSHRPLGARFSFAAGVVFLVALILGVLFGEMRWRGGFSSLFPLVTDSRDKQLKSGELDFRQGNEAAALKLFQGLAAANDPVAQYWLAHMSELGLGVPKDIPKAISLYEKAAAQNSIPAETRLGEIYLHGNLTPPDYRKAFDFLGKAARQGDPRAAMLLGQTYRFGLGTPVDPIESYAWSEVAVIEGLSFAKIEREAAFASMSPADREKGAERARVLLAEIQKTAAPPAKP